MKSLIAVLLIMTITTVNADSSFIYNDDGTSSWKPEGSPFIYHDNGTSSWQPEGSPFIYHEDGSSSWQPRD